MMEDTTLGIFGMGYVGREVARLGLERGYNIHAYDVDEAVIENLRESRRGTDFSADALVATTDGRAVAANADVLVLAVPTPLDSSYSVDLSSLRSATRTASAGLNDNPNDDVLAVVESTVPPGTTDTVVADSLTEEGLTIGEDVYLAHAPERIDPGNDEWTLELLPRVVGAVTEEGCAAAAAFYGEFLNADVYVVDSPGIAEAAKIIENAFRDINIAFVNEIALSLEGMDIDAVEALDAAHTKPFGFMRFEPGAGVGGHCIPVDPHLLIDQATQSGFDHQLLKLARDINERMPKRVAQKTVAALNDARVPPYNATVVLLGKAFKPGVTDARNSPYFDLRDELLGYDCTLETYDPMLPDESTIESPYVEADAVVLVTAHEELVALDAERLVSHGIKVVIDGRNALDRVAFESEGITYSGVGVE